MLVRLHTAVILASSWLLGLVVWHTSAHGRWKRDILSDDENPVKGNNSLHVVYIYADTTTVTSFHSFGQKRRGAPVFRGRRVTPPTCEQLNHEVFSPRSPDRRGDLCINYTADALRTLARLNHELLHLRTMEH